MAQAGEVAVGSRVKKMVSPVAMATPILRIATFHSSSLGSLIAALPALATLRDSFPGARICSFARAPLLPLLQNFAAVDEAHVRPGGGISSQAALMARLHGADYNLALSFSQGSNAFLLMWATGAPIRAGFVPSRMDALLTHKIHKEGPLRIPDALELARSVGATPRGEVAREWLNVPFETPPRAEALLGAAGIERDYIVVSTERRKSDKGVESPEVTPEMVQRLAERFPVVLVGLKPASPALREVGDTAHPVLDLGGKTDVLTLTYLCQTARGIFARGNGVIQLGKLFNKPTVALSDSDDPAGRALQLFGF
ncbi:lipopolysaccharide heptosyltransferase family protein [bacterium]|nr:MAG: lipopolysaccharide heptosyltransferase family protein [bacterium]